MAGSIVLNCECIRHSAKEVPHTKNKETRLQDLEVKYLDPKDTFTMSDLFGGLQEAIWSELKTGSEINSLRMMAAQ